MTAAKKTGSGRNAQRKRDYFAKADGGSRNQHALDKPFIGRLVDVTEEVVEKIATRRRGDADYDNPQVVTTTVKVKPYVKVVHDDGPKAPRAPSTNAASTSAALSQEPRRARRQLAA